MGRRISAWKILLANALLLLSADARADSGSCDYYASPLGGGSGLEIGSPFSVADFWAVAGPGMTLCLLDGVYSGSRSTIDPPDNLNGVPGAPITVRALNEGNVRLDGAGARIPIHLRYNDWFVIDGLDAHNSSGSVVSVDRGAEHNVIRRVVAWDARDENTEIFGAHYNRFTLFEDVAGFGIARKIFQFSQEGDDTTCRRCWGRWEGSTNVGPKMTFSLYYNNIRAKFENVIGTWDNGSMPPTYTRQNNGTAVAGTYAGIIDGGEPDQPYGIFSSDRMDSVSTVGARLFGSLAYVETSARFDPIALINVYGSYNDIEIINVAAHAEAVWKSSFSLSSISGVTGLLASNLTSVGTKADYFASGWATRDVERAGHSSELGDSIYEGRGAHLCYRSVDGVETSVPLWPWPMNARIVRATRLASAPDHQHWVYQGAAPVLTLVTDPHAPVNVTAAIQALFGPIPSHCMAVADAGPLPEGGVDSGFIPKPDAGGLEGVGTDSGTEPFRARPSSCGCGAPGDSSNAMVWAGAAIGIFLVAPWARRKERAGGGSRLPHS